MSNSISTGLHKSNYNNASSSYSGRRITESDDQNICRSSCSTNKSWETSLGSTDLKLFASHSIGLSANDQLNSDYQNYSNLQNFNSDDTSPFGGPSTSDDIIIIPLGSIEEKSNNSNRKFVKERIHQLGLQLNTAELSQDKKSGRSTSNTTTSGSFSLREDSSTGSDRKRNEQNIEASKTCVQDSFLVQGEFHIYAGFFLPNNSEEKTILLFIFDNSFSGNTDLSTSHGHTPGSERDKVRH